MSGTRTHGLSKHPLYGVWNDMLRRCNNPNYRYYSYYGARGITVCPEWHNVTTFVNWAVENGWQKGLELDRRDNNGNYEPNNCRFVDATTQNRNKRDRNRWVNPDLPPGVSVNGKGFNAQIEAGGKTRYLGFHRTPEEARETFLWARERIQRNPEQLDEIVELSKSIAAFVRELYAPSS